MEEEGARAGGEMKQALLGFVLLPREACGYNSDKADYFPRKPSRSARPNLPSTTSLL